MGDSPAYVIEQAGDYLLKLLLDFGQLTYSNLNDGTDEANDRLRQTMGFDEGWDDPAHLIDLAVDHLERQGIVRMHQLDAWDVVGHHDYMVQLTDAGRELITKGEKPTYHET